MIFRLGVNTTPRDTDCSFIAGLSYEFVDITSARRSERRSRSAEATLPLVFPSAAFIYRLGYEV